MLIILSPAKTLNFEPQLIIEDWSDPVFIHETEVLVKELQKFSPSGLQKLMSVSEKLSLLNFERYQGWYAPNNNSKQAILAFDGDVYDGLNADHLSKDTLLHAQNRLRILSGLYGVLKPLDLIKPHRLEMGTPLCIRSYKNLYEFWQKKIVQEINRSLFVSGSDFLLNLASKEYFSSIDQKKLKAKIISIDFRDFSNGSYKIIPFYAKKARGMMSRFILENRILNTEHLKAFDMDGYHFAPSMSSGFSLVFRRDH